MNFLVFLSAVVACAAGVPLSSSVHKVEGRISGGSFTRIRRIPYQVSIHHYGNFKCGGSIINKNWVVSVQHCFRDKRNGDLYSANEYIVRAGSSWSNCFGDVHNVTEIIRHERYNARNDDFDVALLKVNPKFTFGTYVGYVTLQTTEVAAGKPATISGWGGTWIRGPRTILLRSVTVKIMGNSSCTSNNPKDDATDNMICAGDFYGEQGAGKGDSGGPLVVDGELVGIILKIYLRGNDVPRTTLASIKVLAVRDWILENTQITD